MIGGEINDATPGSADAAEPTDGREESLPILVTKGASQEAEEGTNARHFSELEKRVRALEESGKGFWKRFGMVLGILGGLIVIPKSVYDVWVLFHPSPKVEFVWRDVVQLSYDPQARNVNLIYRVSIDNTRGTAEDRITSASVRLQVAQPEPFFLGANYINFDVDQHRTSVPLTIGKGEYRDMWVYVTLTPEFSAYALANPGPRETDVNFTLQSKGYQRPVSKRFCLHEMDSAALKRVVDGQPWTPDKTSCGEG